MEYPVHIVCFGNVLHGDDGFGIHVCRKLQALPALPTGVAVFEAGVAGWNALGYFEECRKVVIVDAVRGGERVGSVRRLRLPEGGPPSERFSLHAMDVTHVIAYLSAASASAPPEIVLVGAEIGDVVPFTGVLTPEVGAAIDPTLREVLRECMS